MVTYYGYRDFIVLFILSIIEPLKVGRIYPFPFNI